MDVEQGVRIAANSFTFTEVELLVKILKNKFNLDCTIQLLKPRQNYIKSSSILKTNSYTTYAPFNELGFLKG